MLEYITKNFQIIINVNSNLIMYRYRIVNKKLLCNTLILYKYK